MTPPPARASKPLVGAILLILALTLPPGGATQTSEGLCLICGDRATADALLNVLLFAPFGFALRQLGISVIGAFGLGAALSLSIEGFQFFIPGRDASAADVFFNAVGACAGALLAGEFVRSWFEHRGRRAFVAGGLVVVIVVASGFLLSPDPGPSPHPLDVQPTLGPDGSRFEGEVLNVQTGRSAAVEAGAVGLTLDIAVRFRDLPYKRTLRPLVGVRDARGETAALFGPRRDHLVLQLRRTGGALRLPNVEVGLSRVFSGRREGEYEAWTRPDGRRAVCIGVAGAGARCGLGYSAASGWALFYGAPHFTWARRRLIDGLWSLLLFVPLGLLLDRDLLGSAVAAGALASLFAAPLLLPIMFTPALAWAGALAGLGIGRVGRRWLERRTVAGRPHPTSRSPDTSPPTCGPESRGPGR